MRQPLLSVYYTGHGVHDITKGKLSIILNEVEPKKRYFPLMTNLESNASKRANSFIMAAFDCCRDQLKQMPKRSLSPGREDFIEEGHNLFIVYGQGTTDGKFVLKKDFCDQYKLAKVQYIKENGGILQVPRCFDTLKEMLPSSDISRDC